MKKFLIGILLSLLMSGTASAADFISYVSINQTSPVFGQGINFTMQYPQEASKSAHNTQQHDNPQIQVDCSQNGVAVFRENAIVLDKTKITGGWNSQSTFMNLSANGGNGLLWTSGGADCTATLYSFYSVVTVWAQQAFTVGP